jgi:isochorismate pyruvate lyase
MRPLTDIRREIDSIDDQIVDLLARRFALAPQVIAYKKANGLPVVIPERVDEVIQRNMARAAGTAVPPSLIQAIYRAVIDAYCEIESREI